MITDRLYGFANSDPNLAFLVFEDRTITYREMAELVNQFAHRLATAGIERGQHVALLCGNRPAFLIAWFALTELGAVTVPLNTSLIGDGLRYTLTQSESMALLIEPELMATKQDVLSDLADGGLQILELDDEIETLSGTPSARFAQTPAGAGTTNSILYTSGTTGLPKGAVISNGSYEAAGIDMARSLELDQLDRILVFLPLFHANPQMYAVMSVLERGATMILLAKFSGSEFFAEARRHRATGFTFVGTILSILEKKNPLANREHQLRWCVGGGAPAPVWRTIEERFGIAVRELYGMTETGGWVTMNTSAASCFGSVGRARTAVDVAVRDETGAPVPNGKKGEIVVRSHRPFMFFDGYWKKPDITASTIRDSWLYTGDRGWLDDDGFLYFDGRLKELIRRGGEMISPVEIELQLLKHPHVKDCGVVGVPDDILGEEIQAVIVSPEELDPSTLHDFLSTRLPRHMWPRYLVLTDVIPKTETQKIKRHELAGISGQLIDLRTPV